MFIPALAGTIGSTIGGAASAIGSAAGAVGSGLGSIATGIGELLPSLGGAEMGIASTTSPAAIAGVEGLATLAPEAAASLAPEMAAELAAGAAPTGGYTGLMGVGQGLVKSLPFAEELGLVGTATPLTKAEKLGSVGGTLMSSRQRPAPATLPPMAGGTVRGKEDSDILALIKQLSQRKQSSWIP